MPQPDVLARAAAVSEPDRQWVEELAFLRFHGDRSKRIFLDAMGELSDYMKATNGGEVPGHLKQAVTEWYKTSRFLDAKQRLVVRRHAQSLRSLQDDIWDLDQFKLDPADAEAGQLLRDLAGPAGPGAGAGGGASWPGGPNAFPQFKPDEIIAKVIRAVDENRPEVIDQLIRAVEIEGFDPNARLDKAWTLPVAVT